jgi:broad specificity phosphatase PhoE
MAKVKIVEKKVYIFRHADDERTVDGIQRGAEGCLTPEGELRAMALAKRLQGRGIQKLIAADTPRAIATMRPVAAELKLPFDVSNLLPERRRPSFAIGQHENNPEVRRQLTIMDELYPLTGDRHSDEEDLRQLDARATQALDHFLSLFQEVDVLAACSHNNFMRAIFAHIYTQMGVRSDAKNRLSLFDFKNAYDTLDIPHTGILPLCYKQKYRSDEMIWKIKFE